MSKSLIIKLYIFFTFTLLPSLIFINPSKKEVLERELVLFHVEFYNKKIIVKIFHDSPELIKFSQLHYFQKNIWLKSIPLKLNFKRGLNSHSIALDTSSFKNIEESRIEFETLSYIHQKVEVFDYRVPDQKIPEKVFFESEVLVFENFCPIKNTMLMKAPKIRLLNSCIIFNGDVESDITLFFSNKEINADGNSNITFMNIKSQLTLFNIKINGGGTRWSSAFYLSGSLNIYNVKNLSINNLNIRNSLGEDALHIKESSGEIKNSNFHNSLLDAIDIDISNIKIQNLDINGVGGDGIDFSRSSAKVSNVKFQDIIDKALSIGESSIIRGNNLSFIEPINIWVASKDSSKFYYNNTPNEKFKVYQKKKLWSNGEIIYE